MSHSINRPALAVFPNAGWQKSIEDGLLSVAPKGLNNLFTQMCGSCANEGAMKAAFFAYRARERGENASFSPEELSSCMKNNAPGSPDLSVMSFTGAFHGRLMGTLSLTRSKAIHKVCLTSLYIETTHVSIGRRTRFPMARDRMASSTIPLRRSPRSQSKSRS